MLFQKRCCFINFILTYLNYYRNEIMQEGDNPTIGIILCTEKGSNNKVLYATSGLDKRNVAPSSYSSVNIK
jgi:YhcG PDDEXK nuclease domain